MPVQVGRREAIARFYRCNAERLRRGIRAKIVDLDDALIDEACAFAWEQLLRRPEFDLDHRGACSWLYTVALREAWALSRRQRRHPPSGCMSGDDDVPEPIGFEGDLIDVVADRFEREWLREVLGRLHWRERRELLLYAHGLSYQEIGEATGTSYTAVNRWLARGKQALRDAQVRDRITRDDSP